MSLQPESAGIPWSDVQDTPGAYPASENGSDPVISGPHSLSKKVKARKHEYIRQKTIKIKVGTWNVAAISDTQKDLGAWFVDSKGVSSSLSTLTLGDGKGHASTQEIISSPNIESIEEQEARKRKKESTIPRNDVSAMPSGDEVGIYVLGLQEIVDISSPSEALRPYVDPNPGKKWKHAVAQALPRGYKPIAEQQLIGLLLLIYASPDVAPTISSVSCTSVGTGLMGYMGNKGAVTARIVLGETTRLVFVNSHLAAGADKASLDRRNWDAAQILSRTKFTPISHDGEVEEEIGDGIGDEDFAFWFGDLNYRLEDIPGDDVRRLLLLHTRNEYDVENKSTRKIDKELGGMRSTGSLHVPSLASSIRSLSPSTASHTDDDDSHQGSIESSTTLGAEPDLDPKSDPASLQTTLSSLLRHDQLHQQQKQRRAFYDGWREGDINFLPTYKYDVGSFGMFDSSEKKRGPSWCDRILFRTRRDRMEYLKKVEAEVTAKKRDAEMKAEGVEDAAAEDDVLFNYDPDNDGMAYDDYDEDEDAAQDAELVQTREGYEDRLQIDNYMSHQRVLSSDHKPLDAVFTLSYESVMPELKARVHQEVARELDKAENEGRPGVTLVVDNHHDTSNDNNADTSVDQNGVNWGDVRFNVAKARGLMIANTGRVPATFGFVDRPVEEGRHSAISPPWMDLNVERQSDNANTNPSALKEYTLAPGDSCNIEMTILISDFKFVADLNAGKTDIDDVLVLRVKKGRDHFIPLRGRWLPSCFCRTLEELTHVPDGGVRQLKQRPRRRTGSGSTQTVDPGKVDDENKSIRLSAPRELFALTEAIQDLVERSLAEWEMTSNGKDDPPWKADSQGTGWPFSSDTWTLTDPVKRMHLLADVREALDICSPMRRPFPPEIPAIQRVEILSETLLLFLKSLSDGIITPNLWSQVETRLSSNDKSRQRFSTEETQSWILEILSSTPTHSVAFTFITFMLARVANEIAPFPASSTNIASPTSPLSKATNRASNDDPFSPQSPEQQTPISPSSPMSAVTGAFGSFRRRARSSTASNSNNSEAQNSAQLARRQHVERLYAGVFANAIIRSESVPVRERERKALVERKKGVLEVFLRPPTGKRGEMSCG